jgi:hypothetical protein
MTGCAPIHNNHELFKIVVIKENPHMSPPFIYKVILVLTLINEFTHIIAVNNKNKTPEDFLSS